MCGKRGGSHSNSQHPPKKNKRCVWVACQQNGLDCKVRKAPGVPSSELTVRTLVRGDLGTTPPPHTLPHFSTPTPQPLGVEERRAAAAVGGGTDMTHVEERGSFVIPSLFFLETSVNNLLGVQSAGCPISPPRSPSMLKTTRQGGKKEHKSLMRGEEKRGARLASLISEES